MVKLNIENFSCIKKACIELGDFNIIIGPQASGKSVCAKLMYFFIGIFYKQTESIVNGYSFDQFTKEISDEFVDLFPITSWGQGLFNLSFSIGNHLLKIDRNEKNGVSFFASELTRQEYETLRLNSRNLLEAQNLTGIDQFSKVLAKFEIMNAIKNNIIAELKSEFLIDQFFIPSGRSLFTTLGKAFLVLEQNRSLDSITRQFGRIFASYLENPKPLADFFSSGRQSESASELIGGTLVWEQDNHHLRSADGRILPFRLLSSGQQELLPLLAGIAQVGFFYAGKNPGPLIYIEEPEAHLFPSTQSDLASMLVTLVNRQSMKLFITTHSPYVLTKVNNLIFSGILEKDLPADQHKQLESIVSKDCRLKKGSVKAYAIRDGVLDSIIDENGLIAADYLDDISTDIAKEFDALLDLEPVHDS